MTRLRSSILCAVAVIAIGLTTYFATARESHPSHPSNSPAIDGPLSNATVSFGEWMTPLDRFPNSSPAAANHHELIPKVATIKAGGTVNFIIAGFHNINVYDDGTQPEDINTALTVPPTAQTMPLLINDPNRRIYRGLDPSLQWDAMRAAYHPGAMVDISWLNGPATEFVSRAKQIYELGGRSLHLHGPVLVNTHGDRATADMGAQLFVAGNIKGVECRVQSFIRIVDRLERRGGKWGIVLFQAIYQMDMMAAVNPGQRLDLDQEKLASFRSSYRYLSYYQAHYGIKTRPDLPGTDRPESVEAVYRANESWLKGEGRKS